MEYLLNRKIPKEENKAKKLRKMESFYTKVAGKLPSRIFLTSIEVS